MGTRGAYGFFVNGMEKVAYNHWDSYPSQLGASILAYCQKTKFEDMAITANRIILVDGNSQPDKASIKRYKEMGSLDEGVGNQTENDWYCLLRGIQGDISAFDRGFLHMIDGHTFLADSLFCEWAYIINLDTQKLEVYKGFNKDPKAPGRYASLKDGGHEFDDNDGKGKYSYYGVVLLGEIPLAEINSLTEAEFVFRFDPPQQEE